MRSFVLGAALGGLAIAGATLGVAGTVIEESKHPTSWTAYLNDWDIPVVSETPCYKQVVVEEDGKKYDYEDCDFPQDTEQLSLSQVETPHEEARGSDLDEGDARTRCTRQEGDTIELRDRC